jgi:hypothetical protein
VLYSLCSRLSLVYRRFTFCIASPLVGEPFRYTARRSGGASISSQTPLDRPERIFHDCSQPKGLHSAILRRYIGRPVSETRNKTVDHSSNVTHMVR